MTIAPPGRQVVSIKRLALPGLLAGLIAAVCTVAVAAIARALGIGLEVQSEPIPLPAFALWCLVGSGIGIVLAWLLRNRRRFIIVAAIGTVLSLIPPIAFPDDIATKAVLVATHLIAAAIVIPILGRRFTPSAASPLTQEEHA
ncbi:DUF6069 family protein [Brooklawnia sp.]|jgi:hypothetical protein|uniref:DUF6069 family protein n=1 Tax=Brooklawnia sp. TaxID=2699740 RepID=UPI00311D95DB